MENHTLWHLTVTSFCHDLPIMPLGSYGTGVDQNSTSRRGTFREQRVHSD
jgi:hypothetical protein